MGFFKRIFGGSDSDEPARAAATPTSLVEGSSGKFGLEIVGESNYQPALRRAFKSPVTRDGGRPVVRVVVECEPTNPYDSQACRVITTDGDTIGYLSRGRARDTTRLWPRSAGA